MLSNIKVHQGTAKRRLMQSPKQGFLLKIHSIINISTYDIMSWQIMRPETYSIQVCKQTQMLQLHRHIIEHLIQPISRNVCIEYVLGLTYIWKIKHFCSTWMFILTRIMVAIHRPLVQIMVQTNSMCCEVMQNVVDILRLWKTVQDRITATATDISAKNTQTAFQSIKNLFIITSHLI